LAAVHPEMTVACCAARLDQAAVDIALLADNFGFAPNGLASDFIKTKGMELLTSSVSQLT
jgi:hypothetical protein